MKRYRKYEIRRLQIYLLAGNWFYNGYKRGYKSNYDI